MVILVIQSSASMWIAAYISHNDNKSIVHFKRLGSRHIHKEIEIS